MFLLPAGTRDVHFTGWEGRNLPTPACWIRCDYLFWRELPGGRGRWSWFPYALISIFSGSQPPIYVYLNLGVGGGVVTPFSLGRHPSVQSLGNKWGRWFIEIKSGFLIWCLNCKSGIHAGVGGVLRCPAPRRLHAILLLCFLLRLGRALLALVYPVPPQEACSIAETGRKPAGHWLWVQDGFSGGDREGPRRAFSLFAKEKFVDLVRLLENH